MKKKIKAIERKLKQILDLREGYTSKWDLTTQYELALEELLDDVRDWIDQGAWDEQD